LRNIGVKKIFNGTHSERFNDRSPEDITNTGEVTE